MNGDATSVLTSRMRSTSLAFASMVVWDGGKMRPSEYRQFRIRSVEGADDFASLAEAALGILLGLAALLEPALTERVLVYLMAAWAILVR